MDDLVKSVSNIQDAQEHYKQIVSVMSKSGFALKKWASNKPEVLEKFGKKTAQYLTLFHWTLNMKRPQSSAWSGLSQKTFCGHVEVLIDKYLNM